MRALELIGGSSLKNHPMFLSKGDALIEENGGTLPAPHAFRLMGERFLPSHPFENAYLLPVARRSVPR